MKRKNFQYIWNWFLNTWQSNGLRGVTSTFWGLFWMRFAGLSYLGRIATCLATWFAPPYYERRRLARYNPKGYIAPSATIHHGDLQLGANVFIGDRVMIFQDTDGGPVELADRVHLYNETYIQTGYGGSLKIGSDTHVQPRCQFSAYKAAIQIGCGVQIAPNCAFYPYDHGIASGELIGNQPLVTKGGITIDDDAWLGFGVIVLDGVRIGKGAVIGAGAVVTQDVPNGAIAVGVPARIVNMRSNLKEGNSLPVAINTALAEVEETVENVHQRLQTINDTVPAHLVLENLWFHQLLNCIRQAMAVDTVALLLKTEDGQQLAVHATLGLEEEVAKEIKIPIGQGFAGYIAASCKPMIVDDLATLEVASPILRDKGIRSMVGVPLLIEDQLLGVFHIGTLDPRKFNTEDEHLLQLVANRIALAIDQLEILNS
jgi:acetyltransferase-like isoleucine patch superfamily enzyme/putative methionine-R-sulfoxide reductase with GAF domain